MIRIVRKAAATGSLIHLKGDYGFKGLTLSRTLAIAFALSAPLAGSQITIRIYDYADVKPRLLHRARQQTAKILEGAGVVSHWEEYRMSEMRTERDSWCGQQAGAAVIQLRVCPENMAKQIATAVKQFGYALPSDRGFGVIAGVYLDRILAFSCRRGHDAGAVLGYAMAHEIGHLLLGTNSHASQGIMRRTWDARDICLAHQGILAFTPAQTRRLQLQVRQRLRSDSR